MDFKKLIHFFIYAGCKDEKEYRSIFPEIQKTNLEVFKILTATLSFVVFCLILTSHFLFFYYEFIQNYFFIFLFSIFFTFLVWGLPEKYLKLTQPLLYIFIFLAFFFSIINGIMVPNVNAVGFIVTLITLPLLFIDRPIRIIFISLTSMAVFALAVLITKPYFVIMYDITNVSIYGLCGIVVSNYIVYVKVSKLLTDKKLLMMSETDILTGLRNRNSYEENLSKYPNKCKFSLTCIYLDANGLHELNNSKGHKAGDEMLCTIADLLKETFYPPDIYRIGGDEFVIFVVDDKNGSAPAVMNDISEHLQQKDYNVSWGLSVASAGLIDMTSLIIETEQKMYKAKAAYYHSKGIDRRRKR